MPLEAEVNSSNIFFPLLGQKLIQKIENENKIIMIDFFFWIGNRNFIDIKEYCVHDDEHLENETNTYKSKPKASRLIGRGRIWAFYEGMDMNFLKLVFTEDMEDSTLNCRSISSKIFLYEVFCIRL